MAEGSDAAVVLRGFNLGDDRYEPGDSVPTLSERDRRYLAERGAIPDDGPSDLLKLSRSELDAQALELGIDEPGKLANKTEVAEAIRDALIDETREELDERARDAGVPAPEDLPNKRAVLAAIEASGEDGVESALSEADESEEGRDGR